MYTNSYYTTHIVNYATVLIFFIMIQIWAVYFRFKDDEYDAQ
jgi:hypothetical protein